MAARPAIKIPRAPRLASQLNATTARLQPEKPSIDNITRLLPHPAEPSTSPPPPGMEMKKIACAALLAVAASASAVAASESPASAPGPGSL
uniref:Uncharacterized protein n=1 Tax=Oryza glumipatula TaxID=40148 RepID=A0A0D9YNQ4_9ORYZ